jgi:hypothetical protein
MLLDGEIVMSLADTKHIVKISTNIGCGCEHCDFYVDPENFADSVNHYVSDHGYSIIYIGQESIPGEGAYHTTVAILGTDNPPPLKPPMVLAIDETTGAITFTRSAGDDGA